MLDTTPTRFTPGELAAAGGEKGIRVYPADATRVRAVWHLDVDDAATEAAITACRDLLSA
jgi:threonine aldolase